MNSLQVSWPSNPCASAVGGPEGEHLPCGTMGIKSAIGICNSSLWMWTRALDLGKTVVENGICIFLMEVAEMKEVCDKFAWRLP